MPKQASSPKKHRLTLAQLTAYDDILTDALVDHVGLIPSSPKDYLLNFIGLLLDYNPEEQERISLLEGHYGRGSYKHSPETGDCRGRPRKS